MSSKQQIAQKYPVRMRAEALPISEVKWYQTPKAKHVLLAVFLGFLFMFLSCPYVYGFVGGILEKIPGMSNLVSPVQLRASLSCRLVIVHAIVFGVIAFAVLSYRKCC